MLDLDALLAQIGDRLMSVDTIALSQPQLVEESPTERMQILIFALGDLRYGLDTHHIAEVVRQSPMTPVPGVPAWIAGVINLHGEIISVVDLAGFLQLERQPSKPPEKMIVAQTGDQRIGLLVDGVDLIYSFPVEQITSPAFIVQPELVPYLRGAVERERSFIRLLDGERLLLGSEMQQFQ